MTVSTTAPIIKYTGNGSTTSFAVPFTFSTISDLKVELITIATGDVTLQTPTTHYTISGSNVVFVTAPTSSYKVVITYSLDFEQSTNYIANDAFNAETHEAALDTLAKQIKEVKSDLDNNTFKLPTNLLTSTTVGDTEIAADRVVAINATADGIQLADIEDIFDIAGLDAATPANADYFVFADNSDSDTLKKVSLLTLSQSLAGVDLSDYVPYAETSSAGLQFVIDEDNMSTNSASKVPTQQSVKAYVDASVPVTFKTIAVSGQSDVVADSATDTLTLAAGSNVTITTNATTDTITIAASGGGGGLSDGDYGDITVSGSSTVLTIDNDVVTYAKIQNVSATDKILGRSSVGAGDVEEIACTAAGRAILDDADASAQRTTLGLGTIATQAANSVSISGGSITGITDLAVADGGTGLSSTTAYAVLCGGTTSTGALQSIASVGTSGQVLTSNGAGALPTFQNATGGGVTVGKSIALNFILR